MGSETLMLQNIFKASAFLCQICLFICLFVRVGFACSVSVCFPPRCSGFLPHAKEDLRVGFNDDSELSLFVRWCCVVCLHVSVCSFCDVDMTTFSFEVVLCLSKVLLCFFFCCLFVTPSSCGLLCSDDVSVLKEYPLTQASLHRKTCLTRKKSDVLQALVHLRELSKPT